MQVNKPSKVLTRVDVSRMLHVSSQLNQVSGIFINSDTWVNYVVSPGPTFLDPTFIIRDENGTMWKVSVEKVNG